MGNFTHHEQHVGDTYIGTIEEPSYWILKGSWSSMRKTPTWCVKNVWKNLKNNWVNPWNSQLYFVCLYSNKRDRYETRISKNEW
jgi:hypothetical protein